MVGFSILGVFAILFYLIVPALILYVVIKLAVKKAIKEVKDEGTL
jgi:hypothetical protein